MPSRNTIKQYIENGHYHIYNRGVEKRNIFKDEQDYRVFLHLLKTLLSPLSKEFRHPLSEVTGFNPVRFRPLLKTLHGEVELLAYCLMPNHFHLLLKQTTRSGMSDLMRRLSTAYSMYFNKKYRRVGHLFQGIYKAAYVDEDSYLLHLSRYIHLNPLELALTGFNLVKATEYPYSSYAYYLGKKNADWINPRPILAFFKTRQRMGLKDFFSYESFVEDFKEDPKETVGTLAIEQG